MATKRKPGIADFDGGSEEEEPEQARPKRLVKQKQIGEF